MNKKLPVSFKEKSLKLSKIPIFNINRKNILYQIKGYENIVTSLNIYNKYLKNTKFNILIDESYNDKILTISQTRNGCSLSIGGAGIIWGTAFGALSMGAGAAASLVFLLMAEALC